MRECEFYLIQNDEIESGVICLAVYRPDPELLKRQITSIRDQTERRWHCLIGIDGADPAVVTLLDQLTDGDERFTVEEFAENVGFYRNFERIIAMVDPALAWVALADQDDFWYPQKLERLLPALLEDGVTLVSGQARLVDPQGAEHGRTHRRSTGLSALLLDNQVTGSFSAFRPTILAAALPFPQPTDVAYHDHWLGVVAECEGEIVMLDEVLQDYIQHASNVIGEETGERRIADRVERLRAQRGSARNSIQYLREHRWGWRVAMSNLSLERIKDLSRDDHKVLLEIALDRLSFAFIGRVAAAVGRRRVPALRGLALLVAAASPR